MRAFYRLLGERSPGGELVDRDGVLAAVVPSCPNQSIVNAVVYDQAAALDAHRGEVQAAYARAGVRAWMVWVPEGDREAAGLLERAGHRLDGSPRAMTMDLLAADFDGYEELDRERAGDVAAVTALNERAYGLPEGEFAQALTAMAGSELYLAHDDGEPAACVAAVDADGDCGIYCVATRQSSRRRGLASALMRQALTDARDRGCVTSSLQSSKIGFSVYGRLGYRDVGAIDKWQYRRG